MPALISVTGLSYAFGDGDARKNVLDQISVDFYPGEIVIIMGPSGAGKTTLLTLVGALRSVQTGSVSINGTELRTASPQTLRGVRRRIGFIFQEHNLLASLTARQNVQLALATDPESSRKTSRAKARELLSLVGLEQHADKLPHQLSGGQKQRVAIARALVRSPEIILADEPTAALDGPAGRAVVELLQHLASQINCAVLLVTHDNRILDIADRILTLEDGRMDESNLRMERLTAEAASLLKLLARLPGVFNDGAASESLMEQFQPRLSELLGTLRRIVGQHGGAASERALRWTTVGERLGNLKDSLGKVATLIRRCPPGATEFAEAITDSLDFLVNTAADASVAPPNPGVDLLLQLTTDDHGTAVNSVRDRFMKFQDTLTPEASGFVFELSNMFLRTTYVLHEIAKVLRGESGA